MGIVEPIRAALQTIKNRSTKSLKLMGGTSAAAVVVFGALQFLTSTSSQPWNTIVSVLCVVGLTLASSIFAACAVSILFDIKSIRDLVVKNDADLLLRLLLRSDELFSTNGSDGGEHEAILKNIRLKATAALNGIDLNDSAASKDELTMKKGHLEACLAHHDEEVNSAYARYVNVTRRISNEGNGVFRVDETTYVRYRNDTGNSKRIRSWNYLDSGLLPESYIGNQGEQLKETIKITINDRMPSVHEHTIVCRRVVVDGVDALMRRWENDWGANGYLVDVPANGTCTVEMIRVFLIPQGEEIKYRWDTIRSECNYTIMYEGDDFEPTIAITGCNLCDSSNKQEGCFVCNGSGDQLVDNSGHTKHASIKGWPKPGTGIRVTWGKQSSQTTENVR